MNRLPSAVLIAALFLSMGGCAMLRKNSADWDRESANESNGEDKPLQVRTLSRNAPAAPTASDTPARIDISKIVVPASTPARVAPPKPVEPLPSAPSPTEAPPASMNRSLMPPQTAGTLRATPINRSAPYLPLPENPITLESLVQNQFSQTPVVQPGNERLQLGETNARNYCSLCHLFPEPDLLPRQVWLEDILPLMAPGGSDKTPIRTQGSVSFDAASAPDPLEAARQHAPQLDQDTWNSIVEFYLAMSSEELRVPVPDKPIDFDLPGFEVETPQGYSVRGPGATAVRIDPERQQILVGAIEPDVFLVFDNNLEIVQEAHLSSPPTWFQHFVDSSDSAAGRKLAITLAGRLDPNDLQAGNLLFVEEAAEGGPNVYENPTTVVSNLRRPVHVTLTDLNGDGVPDPVLSEFGNNLGKLSLHETSPGGLDETILIPLPGALMTRALDWDDDGDTDLLALLTQGREGIYLVENQGTDGFRLTPLILHDSVFGTSSFDVADFDNDGLQDIILTCGDNADYTPILKPYHGVYYYRNLGDGSFAEEWFYPINGAFQIRVADFDLDGDQDLVSLSYFPDYQQRPMEAFVYFRNDGSPEAPDFSPFTTERSLEGRWLPMDVGDVDGDGDVDIVLGNFTRRMMGPIPADLRTKWSQPGIHIMLLRNQTNSPEAGPAPVLDLEEIRAPEGESEMRPRAKVDS